MTDQSILSVRPPWDIVECEQGTPEWFAARVGRLTGTMAGDMLAVIKTGEAAARRNLRTRLVVERLTGQPQEDGYVSAAMQRGLDKQPDAVAAYETLTGHLVRTTGFIRHLGLPVGCSLDGDVDDCTGIVEIKCPLSATHLRYLQTPGIPSDYLPQVTHNLWVTGAHWCDFLSYDDRFPEDLRVHHVRVRRTDLDLRAYEAKVVAFLAEVDEEFARVEALRQGRR